MKAQLKAILFDLDGVIVDTAKYHYLAWKKLADREGIYFDEKINERLKGVSRMASLEIILERSTRAYSEQEKLEMTEIKNNWYREMIEQLRPDEILPGVIDFLNSLKMNGIKCAICSASKSAAFIIDKLGITQYFDTIVGGQDITKSKPDPEVFLVAAERLNTLPAECVVFEDAYAGIEGAKRAGMKAVGLGDPNILTNADIVCKDMTEITLEKVMKLFQ
ncbi:MAG TPA: beta-phosphoglucomutase [Clostridiaceae bacterium]|nr:beta-phosphoglucomutase [Clostridiaceae bacterium]